jgi:hypothetical protein
MKYITIILMMAMTALAETNQTVTLEQKLTQIVIPEIQFRDAHPLDVIDFLVDAATPQGRELPVRLSIILNVTNQTQKAQSPDPRENLTKGIPPLTLEMKRVSLLDAIKEITTRAGLTYELTKNSVLIKTKDGKVLNKEK